MFGKKSSGKMNKSKIFSLFLVTWIILGGTLCLTPNETKSLPIFFTLKAISHNEGVGPIYLTYIKAHLERIGINLDIYLMDWSAFASEIFTFRDFDICYFGFTGGGAEPDFTGVYNENGTLNMFGYHISMDWDMEYGTGINEWFMREGKLIIPPDSEERVQHYWTWQIYLMDRVVPCMPLFAKTDFTVNRASLDWFSAEKGILESWGKMNWNAPIVGKDDYSELLTNGEYWEDLNPLNQTDSASSYISSFILDPLIYFDSEQIAWPHLAKDWIFLNDTHLRISLREDIMWQPDPDGNFTNEYFDAQDVYFTLFCHSKSIGSGFSSWLDDFKIIDSVTIDLFIDANSHTSENEPTATFFQYLSVKILPEHYLNQTQLADGITPNSTHISWSNFNKHGFGTGLFQIKSSYEDPVTILDMFTDCWYLDPLITNDPLLNFEERFGDFSHGLTTLKFKIYSDINQATSDFNSSKLDILNLYDQINLVLNYNNIFYEIGKIIDNTFEFLGFNMREVRPMTGRRDPAPGDPTQTIGLCIRKAICYAIDRGFIGGEMYSHMYVRHDNPIYPYLGIWNNPNTIRYNFDIDKAREYMTKAGYDLGYSYTYDDWNCGGFIALIVFMIASPFIVVALIAVIITLAVVRSNKKKKEQLHGDTLVIMKTQEAPQEKKLDEAIIKLTPVEEEEKKEINGENK